MTFKPNFVRLAFVLLACSIAFVNTAGAQLVLNEIEADAPDSNAQQECQFVELRGTPGATVPANTYFVVLDGGAGSFGDVSFPVSLGGRTVGANGTITIINDQLNGACPGRTLPSATTTVSVFDFDGLGLIDGGARSYLLITKPTAPATGDDFDSNNDRVIDPAQNIVVLDGISITTNNTFQAAYGTNIFEAVTDGAPGTTFLPDAATRFSNNTTPLSKPAWFFGELASTPASATAYSGTPQSTNFPVGGQLTPGGSNLPALAPVGKAIADFNGDGRTDFSVTRTASGQMTWYTSLNGPGNTSLAPWGLAGDVPVPEDFDGDGKDDIAIWRPDVPFAAAFWILQSSNNTLRVDVFGQTGDNPGIVGDWDGDGKADPAVYRNGTSGGQSTIYFRASNSNPNANITFLPWGLAGDKPMRGDFDGDGKLDAAVFRGSDSTWYILQSTNLQPKYEIFGFSSDVFVPADYDGDAKTDVAIFRGGTWWIKQSSNSSVLIKNWGLGSDVVVPGDYDGDGKDDIAVFRSGTFYALTSTGGNSIIANWGIAGDFPVANTFTE